MYQNTMQTHSVPFMVCVCQPSRSGRRQREGKTDGYILGGIKNLSGGYATFPIFTRERHPWAVSPLGQVPTVSKIVQEMCWSGQVHRMTPPPPVPVFLFAAASTSTMRRMCVAPTATATRPQIASTTLVFAPLRPLDSVLFCCFAVCSLIF